MLQKDYLFEWRSIYSNVMLGLEIQKKKSEKYTKTRGSDVKRLWIVGLPGCKAVAALRRDAAEGGTDPHTGTSAGIVASG